jgi:Fe-S cluster biosynthesis and repair protein YggX
MSKEKSTPAETVFCSRLKAEGEPIAGMISFAGEFAERIRKEVCQEAWNEWLEMQIKVINEYRLHMGDAEHRKLLHEIAARFFRFDGGDGELGPGPEGGLSE